MRSNAALVIQTAFLGDVVLTTPLLARLAERHGRVDVVTTPAAAELIETHPAVREVIRYDKRGHDRGLAGFRHLADQLAVSRYARVYLPHRSWRSAALALAAHIPERIGFADSPGLLPVHHARAARQAGPRERPAPGARRAGAPRRRHGRAWRSRSPTPTAPPPTAGSASTASAVPSSPSRPAPSGGPSAGPATPNSSRGWTCRWWSWAARETPRSRRRWPPPRRAGPIPRPARCRCGSRRRSSPARRCW